eukprot:scaffold60549_cov65-Phaeocystis_antarctica.AAC.2
MQRCEHLLCRCTLALGPGRHHSGQRSEWGSYTRLAAGNSKLSPAGRADLAHRGRVRAAAARTERLRGRRC